MLISFFLTPKADVAWVAERSTVRQTIERMEHHRFTAVPVLTEEGHYVDTVTEGDLLWYLKQHPHVRFEETERIALAEVSRRLVVKPVHVDAHIDTMLALALEQNFVPVEDDRGAFIGIVRRSSILRYFQSRIRAVMPGPPTAD
jgi:CBS-domain-containing membrane protein